MDRLERTPLKEQNTNALRSPIRLSTDKQKGRLAALNKVTQVQLQIAQRRKVNVAGVANGGANGVANGVAYNQQHQNQHQQQHHQHQQRHVIESREAEEELQRWREQWRNIMQSSIFFFDGVDQQNIDKVHSHLTSLGTRIQPFFERKVTHLVTKRPTSVEYPSADVITKAKLLDMKVWTFEKLIRFLTHLLGTSPLDKRAQQPTNATNLSKLLKQEKLLGPSDRDLNAPNDNFRLFKGPYVLIWDPTHSFRPTLYKEFSKAPAEGEGDWAQFRLTPQGQCPFIYVSTKDMMIIQEKSQERKRRLQHQQEAVEKRERERENGILEEEDTSEGKRRREEEDEEGEEEEEEEEEDEEEEEEEEREDEDEEEEEEEREEEEAKDTSKLDEEKEEEEEENQVQTPAPTPFPIANAILPQTQSHLPPSRKKIIVEPQHNSRFYEIAASGITRSNMTSAIRSIAQSGGGQSGTTTTSAANGLAATVAQVPSRELANLQRKVLKTNISKKITNVGDESSHHSIENNNSNNKSNQRIAVAVRPSVATKAEAQAIALAKKKNSPDSKSSKPTKKKMGFCENCQEQFENFDVHIYSKRHRRFAHDDRNFHALDELINKLQRPEVDM